MLVVDHSTSMNRLCNTRRIVHQRAVFFQVRYNKGSVATIRSDSLKAPNQLALLKFLLSTSRSPFFSEHLSFHQQQESTPSGPPLCRYTIPAPCMLGGLLKGQAASVAPLAVVSTKVRAWEWMAAKEEHQAVLTPRIVAPQTWLYDVVERSGYSLPLD